MVSARLGPAIKLSRNQEETCRTEVVAVVTMASLFSRFWKEPEPLYVVVIGDEGAGKTSLVHTLATEAFSSHKHHSVQKPLHIKVDSINKSEIPLVIIDTKSPGVMEVGGGDAEANFETAQGSSPSPAAPPKEDESKADHGAPVQEETLVARLQSGLKVDAVVLAFDAGSDDAFRRLTTHWLPYIVKLRQRFRVSLPIVVAENKIDVLRQLQAAAAVATAKGRWNSSSDLPTVTDSASTSSMKFDQEQSPELTRFASMFRDFSGISACVACSSKRLLNVPDVFRLAASAAMFPTSALLRARAKVPATPAQRAVEYDLSPGFQIALERIFRMANATTFDGVLCAHQYHIGIQSCFPAAHWRLNVTPPSSRIVCGQESQLQCEIESFTSIIRTLNALQPGLTSGTQCTCGGEACRRGITLDGWLYLNRLFLERNRPEAPWRVLKCYGYGTNTSSVPTTIVDTQSTDIQERVVLDEAVLDAESLATAVARGDFIELARPAQSFLERAFSSLIPAHHSGETQDDSVLPTGRLSDGDCAQQFWDSLARFLRLCPLDLLSGSQDTVSYDNTWVHDMIRNRAVAVDEVTGILSLKGWLALWRLAVALQPLRTVKILRYLGVPDPADCAVFTVVRNPRVRLCD